jgi:calcineurin-like phosphoesterase family protein
MTQIIIKNKIQDYVVSDPHFGHDNIRRFCARPFDTIEEHDEILAENWNKVVSVKNSRVWILGDFAFKRPDYWARRLNGSQKILISGNHDKLSAYVMDLFHTVYGREKNAGGLYSTNINGQSVTFCHYPMESWNKSCHGAWHLHGHCHKEIEGSQIGQISRGLRLDVGVDLHDYRPWTWEEIEVVMKEKERLMKEAGRKVEI